MARELDMQGRDKWKKAEKVEHRREEQKQRIREAFSGNPEVEVIPAKRNTETESEKKIRVAAYCRVSTYEDI